MGFPHVRRAARRVAESLRPPLAVGAVRCMAASLRQPQGRAEVATRIPALAERKHDKLIALEHEVQTLKSQLALVRKQQLPQERLDELLRHEVLYLSSTETQAISLQDALDLPVNDLAHFCIQEGPRRLAKRIKMLESLEGWQNVPELVEMSNHLDNWYRALRFLGTDQQDLGKLVSYLRNTRHEGRNVPLLVTAGIHKLCSQRGREFPEGLTPDKWLDSFLMSRIGTNVLADQLVARAGREHGGLARPKGIIDPECDATAVCEASAMLAANVCRHVTGLEPTYVIENYRSGKQWSQATSPCILSFIPSYLRYIIVELLKNSFAATVQAAGTEEEVKKHPVKICVCRDEHRVAILVSDRAGGIPFEVGDKIWSYMYGAAAKSEGGLPSDGGTPLSGYGVGLPMSRLYARYLGGSLYLTSYPGYGTQAHISLPKIDAKEA